MPTILDLATALSTHSSSLILPFFLNPIIPSFTSMFSLRFPISFYPSSLFLSPLFLVVYILSYPSLSLPSSSFSFSVSSPLPSYRCFYFVFHLALIFFVSPTFFLFSCICSVSHFAFVYHRPYCRRSFFLVFLRPAFPCVKYCFCF
jgi:hypothetical protein